jgi:hypothetical protein
VLSGRGLCDELITRLEESYRLYCVVVCDLETSRISAPYINDISSLRVKTRYCKSDEAILVSGRQYGLNSIIELCSTCLQTETF